MSPFFLDTTGPLLAAALYIAATFALLHATRTAGGKARRAAPILAGAAVVMHAIVEYHAWSGLALAQVDIVTSLSLCSLVVVALWSASLTQADGVIESGLFALPVAAIANLLDAFISAPVVVPASSAAAATTPGTFVHIVSSVLAFGLLGLAGMYAGLVLLVDHSLKRHEIGPLVRNLPALDKLEKLLFSLIATGFALLTVALVTGLLYVDNLMAQHLIHKTVLAILAWLVFGALLLGRWFKGWRGAFAVRLTLAGIGLLLLSYFGSKLVLEVILGRSWYS